MQVNMQVKLRFFFFQYPHPLLQLLNPDKQLGNLIVVEINQPGQSVVVQRNKRFLFIFHIQHILVSFSTSYHIFPKRKAPHPENSERGDVHLRYYSFGSV